jgi:hypothetical protein
MRLSSPRVTLAALASPDSQGRAETRASSVQPILPGRRPSRRIRSSDSCFANNGQSSEAATGGPRLAIQNRRSHCTTSALGVTGMSQFPYGQKTRAEQQSAHGGPRMWSRPGRTFMKPVHGATGGLCGGSPRSAGVRRRPCGQRSPGLGNHIDAKRSGKARALSLDGKEQHPCPRSRANRLYG